MGFPVPQGTRYRFCQDIDGCILIAVQHQPTRGTHMCPGGESFLDTLSTSGAILTGVVWCNGDDRDIVHHAVGLHPSKELSTCGIVDTLGEFAVLDQVADL